MCPQGGGPGHQTLKHFCDGFTLKLAKTVKSRLIKTRHCINMAKTKNDDLFIKIPKTIYILGHKWMGGLRPWSPIENQPMSEVSSILESFYSKRFPRQIEDLNIACLQTNNTPFDLFGAS